MVKNVSAMQKTQVQSLGQEDPLEKAMATHSNIHAWRIPWTEEPGGLVHGVANSQIRLSNYCAHTHTYSLLNKSYSEGVQNKAILWLNVIIENLI